MAPSWTGIFRHHGETPLQFVALVSCSFCPSSPETLQADILIYLEWQKKAGTVYWLADQAARRILEQKPKILFLFSTDRCIE